MMNKHTGIIDLNCDVGEGMDTDKELMPYISSANIACGAHAGDENTIARTIGYCLQYDVAIGAHPGFADRTRFGREEIVLDEEALYSLVTTQVRLVKTMAEDAGGRLHHVKPHGALYNMAAANEMYARVIAQAVRDIDPSLIFYGLSNSLMIGAARAAGLPVAQEVFADRSYQDNGRLTPRSQPGALVDDAATALQQALQFAAANCVRSLSGKLIPLPADTICLHGDGEHAVSFARMINRGLKEQGIRVLRIYQQEK